MAKTETSFPPTLFGLQERDQQNFRLTLQIAVRDVDQLWRMAAARALATGELDQDAVEEVIGPVDDPQIADCLAMLLVPSPVAGCVMRAITVEPDTRTSRRNMSLNRAAVVPSPLPERIRLRSPRT